MRRRVAHTRECAEDKLTGSVCIDAIQLLEPRNVYYSVRRFDVQFHQIVKRGAPGQEARPRPAASDGVNGVLYGPCASVAERPHDSGPPHLGGGILDGGDDADIGAAAA